MPSSRRCWCAASTRAGCWWARTSASARAARAICDVLRAHARTLQRRGDAHCRRSTASAPRRRRCAKRLPRARWTRAAALLGRHYTISGRVGARREARTRARAFPPRTCRCRACRPCPASSRCACMAWPRARATGVASVGVRPTVTARRPADARGLPLRLRRIDLRPARRASSSCTSCATRSATPTSTRSLRQIRADVAQARDYFAAAQATVA